MYCLANICFVCLEKKNNLISNIYSSSAVNKDFIDIISYRPFNLTWLKTKRIILICEECYLRLRETCQFLKMCHKNSALLQGYMDNLINTTIPTETDDEAELNVMLDLNIDYNDISEIQCEIPDEEMYTLQVETIIEETFEDYVIVKEEIVCKEEEIDVEEEYAMDNNSTEISANSSNAYITNTDYLTFKEEHETNKKDLNITAEKLYNCTICNKSLMSAGSLKTHARIHSGEKPYKCSRCEKCFSQRSTLVCHIRTHTGERPYECLECDKRFKKTSDLHRHERIHAGVKNHTCSICEKCFFRKSHLESHMRIHTGKKPDKKERIRSNTKRYTCSICNKCFGQNTHLVDHIRTHTGEKPYKCSRCERCFRQNSTLVCHMRTHTGEKPYECLECGECFTSNSLLCKHKRIHSFE